MKNEDVQTNLELTLKNIETFIKKIGDQTVPSPSQRRGLGGGPLKRFFIAQQKQCKVQALL